jgi:hypothetical protein
MTPEEKINALQMYIASRNTEVEELKAENEKMQGALEKIIDRCERGIYDATDAAFVEETARQALTPNTNPLN